MKLTCTQTDLARGLAIVGRAVASHVILPVLANVLLEARDGSLRLAATNLELSITCQIAAQIEEEGALTVPAQTLSDLVQTLLS